jgi:hypothetical protein
VARTNNWPLKPTATLALIAAMFVMFVVAWIPTMTRSVVEWLACDGTLNKPWTYLTYPFAWNGDGTGFVWLALGWLWLYWIGTSIEASDGWKGLLLTFFGYTLLAGFLTAFCGHLAGWPGTLFGAWLPISAMTCIWAGRNPAAIVRLMMCIPVSGKVLAVITAAIDLFLYGTGYPVVGLLAALSCLVGWLHGTGAIFRKRKPTIVSGRGHRAQSQAEFESFITQVRSKEKEREERERLRKLLEGGPSEGPSGSED